MPRHLMSRDSCRKILWASLCLGLLTLSAQARWKQEYANLPDDIKQWYASQRNKNGSWCCNNADGHDFYGGYSLNEDGSVEFDADGAHHRLPAYMVLDGPNPTGHAVWWYLDLTGGGHMDYCFALGPAG